MEVSIAFIGDVVPAECICHRDKFFARAFVVSHGEPPFFLGERIANSKEEAETMLQPMLSECAEEFMKNSNIAPENIKSVKVVKDEEAKTIFNSFKETNPNLH